MMNNPGLSDFQLSVAGLYGGKFFKDIEKSGISEQLHRE